MILFRIDEAHIIQGRGTVIVGTKLEGGDITVGTLLRSDRKFTVEVRGVETMGGRQDIPIGLLVRPAPGQFQHGEILRETTIKADVR